jgi:glutaconate CoA-transferase subunit B
MPEYSQKEFMAVLISRQIQNNILVWIGTSSDIPRAGAILANLTHAPDSTIILGLDEYNFTGLNPLEGKPHEVDFHGLTSSVGALEYRIKTHNLVELFENISSIDLFVIGGMEVDKYGNTNLMGIYDEAGNLIAKGPGPIGAASMASSAKTHVIFMNRHDKKTFVEKVSFRSAFGFGDGRNHREELGMVGNGPSVLISPLGMFDFPKPERAMRLLSCHPGISAKEIQENTDFDLGIVSEKSITKEPSTQELEILRGVIDINGDLR